MGHVSCHAAVLSATYSVQATAALSTRQADGNMQGNCNCTCWCCMYCTTSSSTRVPWMTAKSMHVSHVSRSRSPITHQVSKCYQSSHSDKTRKGGCLFLVLSGYQPLGRRQRCNTCSCDKQRQLHVNTAHLLSCQDSRASYQNNFTQEHCDTDLRVPCAARTAGLLLSLLIAFCLLPHQLQYQQHNNSPNKQVHCCYSHIQGMEIQCNKAPALEGNPLQLMGSTSSPPRASGAAACAQLQAAPRC